MLAISNRLPARYDRRETRLRRELGDIDTQPVGLGEQ